MHPEEVAAIVRDAGLSDDAIAAALLHDVVEDTPIENAEIMRWFGKRVGSYVDDLTDVPLSAGNRATRKAIDRERIAAAGYEPQTIKAADLISNTTTIVEYDPDFAKTYLREKRSTLELLTRAHPSVLARANETLREAEAKIYGPLAALVE